MPVIFCNSVLSHILFFTFSQFVNLNSKLSPLSRTTAPSSHHCTNFWRWGGRNDISTILPSDISVLCNIWHKKLEKFLSVTHVSKPIKRIYIKTKFLKQDFWTIAISCTVDLVVCVWQREKKDHAEMYLIIWKICTVFCVIF